MYQNNEIQIGEFTVFVEPSLDRYNPGFSWSVCRNNTELESGLAFSEEAAVKEAEQAARELSLQQHSGN
jgi:hypothetical protein